MQVKCKHAQQKPMVTLHEYYTPKYVKIQVNLAINIIFVDYANFYVNIIM